MKLAYEKLGTGPPMLVLHGLFGSRSNWLSAASILSQHFTVYLIDARNHGHSPHSELHTYSAMADDLFQFIEQEFIYNEVMETAALEGLGKEASLLEKERARKPIIVGHSMGGKTAMFFATQYPHTLATFIVLDIGPQSYTRNFLPIIQALQDVDLLELPSRADADRQLRSKLPDPMLRSFLLKNLTRTDDGGFRWKINLDALEKNIHHLGEAVPNHAAFEKSCLFIYGTASDYITSRDIPTIYSHFPNAQVHPIENAGHWLHVERREETVTTILNFSLNSR